MKKTFTLFALMLALCIVGIDALGADYTGYTEFDSRTGVLTFKATSSTVPVTSGYITVKKFGVKNTAFKFSFKEEKDYANQIVEAVFDQSFYYAESDYARTWFKGLQNLRKISGWKYVRTSSDRNENWEEMFSGCTSLADLGDFFDKFSTQYVTSCKNMFENCTSLQGADFSACQFSKCTDFERMFYNCTGLEFVSFANAKITAVEDFDKMFYNCTSLKVVNFDGCSTTSLKYTQSMFYNCWRLEAIFVGSGFTVANVGKSGDMFYQCNWLMGLTGGVKWASSNKTDKTLAKVSGGYLSSPSENLQAYAIYHSNSNTLHFFCDRYRPQYYYNIDNTSTTDYTAIPWNNYRSVIKKVEIHRGFPSTSPKSTAFWFYNMTNLTEFVGGHMLNLSETESTKSMFGNCSKLKEINAKNTVYYADKLTDMSCMFYGCSSAETIVSPKRSTKATACLMGSMFYGCLRLAQLPDISTTNATDISWMFYNCKGLTGSVEFYLNTDNCANMSYMFYNCSGITHLTFGSSMKSATTTEGMFYGCTNLQYIYLLKTSDQTSALKNTTKMFYNCSKLRRIYVEDFEHDLYTGNVTNSADMFYNCTSLVGGRNLSFSTNYTNKTYARIDRKVRTNRGYFTPYKATVIRKSLDKDYGSALTITAGRSLEIPDISQTGYEFQGWTCSGLAYNLTTPTKSLIIPASEAAYPITCTAVWKRKADYLNVSLASSTYTGNKIPIVVKDGSMVLTEGTDYTTNRSTVTNAGSYSVTITGKGYYTGSYTKSLTVSKATIKVVCQDKEKTYGSADPALTFTATGFKGSDKIESIKLSRVSGENVGSHTISVSSLTVTNSDNYYISKYNANFTITPKSITVTPDALSKTYGDDDPAEFSYTTSGMKDGDKLSGKLSRVEGENVGEYLITSTLTNSNYNITVAEAKFTITKKDITVTPDASTKQYGEPDPAFTYTAEGLVDDDKLSGKLSREAGEFVGKYAFVNTLANPNYNITLANAKFEIKQKKVTPTIVFESDVMLSTGSEVKPKVTVYDGTTVIPTTEYDVLYGDNINVTDKAKVTVSNVSGGNYEINQTTAYFHIVDKSNAIEITYKNADEEIIAYAYALNGQHLSCPIKEGYTAHAYRKKDKTDEWIFSSDIVSGKTTLYLFWTVNNHTIDFEIDGGSPLPTMSVDYGESVILPDMPTIAGYTFEWISAVPTTMPDNDLTISGAYTKNTHTITYTLDGKEYHTETLEYDVAITPLAAPVAKTGYTFSGWSTIPATMPDDDVEVIGSYIPNKHKLVFFDGTTVVKTIDDFSFGEDITAVVPTKEYYTYTYELPSTGKFMPDKDVTINGTFEPNKHTITYILDGEKFKVVEASYGAPISLITNPDARTGYTFSGWSELPTTMPDEDVEVIGHFAANKHNLVFKIDGQEQPAQEVSYDTKIETVYPQKTGYVFVPAAGSPTTMPDANTTIEGTFEMVTYYLYYYVDNVVYLTEEHHFGDEITPAELPSMTGSTFSGWSEIPATMPAANVTIEGTFTAATYTLTYKIDGEVYQTYTKMYGAYISSAIAKAKSGYTFSGWDNEPTVMPDNDLVVTGSYIKNKYTITYMIDGEEFKTEELEYEAAITPAEAPTKDGFTFSGWNLIYETMPAYNITVTGSYTENGTTPVAEFDAEPAIRVWSYNHTIYIETAPDTKYTIIDLQGRVLTTSTTKSTHDEIQVNASGILVITIGAKSFKVIN